MTDRPKTRPDLETRTVDDETVILDRDGERIQQLNATASFIWDCCDGEMDTKAIAAELAEAFGVEPDLTVKDVSEIVLQFSELGLLEEVGVKSPASE